LTSFPGAGVELAPANTRNALVGGRQFGWTWMDPMMEIVGSIIIARWSYGLLGETSRVLLDAEVAPERQGQIRQAIESDTDNRVVDLHL